MITIRTLREFTTSLQSRSPTGQPGLYGLLRWRDIESAFIDYRICGETAMINETLTSEFYAVNLKFLPFC